MNALKDRRRLVFPLVALVLWQVLCASGLLPPQRIPSPLQILLGVKELTFSGLPFGNSLIIHCLQSLLRVALGFFIAFIIAIPLGIVIGWSRFLRDMLTPIIETIRPIPPLAWIPLAILWFGIGLKSAAFIIFLGCFFPMLLSTTSGVLSVDRLFIDAAKTLGAKEKEIFINILIPGATPAIFTGIRIGLGIGWMTLVAAEFTGVRSGYGLGYMIMVARDIQRPDLIIAGMATIGFVGYILDVIVRRFEHRALRWR